jgi:hypothetical protein
MNHKCVRLLIISIRGFEQPSKNLSAKSENSGNNNFRHHPCVVTRTIATARTAQKYDSSEEFMGKVGLRQFSK